MNGARKLAIPLVLVAVAVGIGVGLFLAWQVFPVTWYDTDPSDLRVEHQRTYVTMVADSLELTGDEQAALQRLYQLTDAETDWQWVADLIEDVAVEHDRAGDIQGALRMRRLAEATNLPVSQSPGQGASAMQAPTPASPVPLPVSNLVLTIVGLVVFVIALVMVVWLLVRILRRPRLRPGPTLRKEEPVAAPPEARAPRRQPLPPTVHQPQPAPSPASAEPNTEHLAPASPADVAPEPVEILEQPTALEQAEREPSPADAAEPELAASSEPGLGEMPAEEAVPDIVGEPSVDQSPQVPTGAEESRDEAPTGEAPPPEQPQAEQAQETPPSQGLSPAAVSALDDEDLWDTGAEDALESVEGDDEALDEDLMLFGALLAADEASGGFDEDILDPDDEEDWASADDPFGDADVSSTPEDVPETTQVSASEPELAPHDLPEPSVGSDPTLVDRPDVTEPVADDIEPDVLGRFEIEYHHGDLDYDVSFSIESDDGEFLGECGVGVADILAMDDAQHVDAFEVWLFDKGDIRTVSQIISSDLVIDDDERRRSLEDRGDVTVARSGVQLLLRTLSLKATARLLEFSYRDDSDVPASVFDLLRVEIVVREPSAD